MKPNRLPRRVHLGRGYVIEVALLGPHEMAEESESDEALDGFWVPSLGEKVAGRIYVDRRLSTEDRWGVYWHELIHAVNDISSWDKHGLST